MKAFTLRGISGIRQTLTHHQFPEIHQIPEIDGNRYVQFPEVDGSKCHQIPEIDGNRRSYWAELRRLPNYQGG